MGLSAAVWLSRWFLAAVNKVTREMLVEWLTKVAKSALPRLVQGVVGSSEIWNVACRALSLPLGDLVPVTF